MTAESLIPLLPAVIKMVEGMVAAGRDPKQEIERIADGYEARARVEAEVAAAGRRKFGP